VRTLKNVDPEQMCLNSIKSRKKLRKLECKIRWCIFDAKGIIYQEFVPEKQTVKDKYYKEVIKRFIARVHRARPEFEESGSWYLLHDKVLAHSSGVFSEFLAKGAIPVFSHPPYSTDFALDFFYSLN
jgi:hypothetical protein